MSFEWSWQSEMVCIVGDGESAFGLGCVVSPKHVLTTARIAGSVGDPRSIALPMGKACGWTLWSHERVDLGLIRLSQPLESDSPAATTQQDTFPVLRADRPVIGFRVGVAEPVNEHLFGGHVGQIARFQTAWIQSIDEVGESELVGSSRAHALPGAPVLQSDGAIIGVVTRARRAPVPRRIGGTMNTLGYFAPLRRCASELLRVAPGAFAHHWMVRQ